jgi:hypothetical protein
LIAVPFYMIVERPFKNFLDLILFPKSSIFKKQKDLDDDDDDDSSESSGDEKKKEHKPLQKKLSDSKKKNILCGFCQEDAFKCDCQCLVTKKKCKCIDRVEVVDNSVLITGDINSGVKRVLKETSEEIMVEEGRNGNNENSVIDSTV